MKNVQYLQIIETENKNYDAFFENMRTDPRIMSFPDPTLREEFTKI